MYSGESAMPTTVSSVREPFMIARKRRAEGEVMGLGEVLAGHDLQTAPPLRKPPLAQEDRVDGRLAATRQRHDHARRRLGHAGDIEQHRLDDAELRRGDARDGADDGAERFRRARRGGEDIAEAVALVVGAARLLKRAIGADRQDQRRHSAGKHQRDGERLRPEPPEIAQQLDVERPHDRYHSTSDGRTRSAFSTVSPMRPSEK